MIKCSWKNFCAKKDKYICCHECKEKDCWQRCKDDLSKCKYKVDSKEEIRILKPSPTVTENIFEEKPLKRRGRPKKNPS